MKNTLAPLSTSPSAQPASAGGIDAGRAALLGGTTMIANRRSPLFVTAALLSALALGVGSAPTPSSAQVSTSDVDKIFAAFSGTETPGCTVAVSEAGQPVLERAYGMADLEQLDRRV